MQTENPIIEKFIVYLNNKLLFNGHHSFDKVGPRTYFYLDGVDTIFVYVRDDNLVIISDGPNVVDGIEMIRLHLYEEDEMVFDSYLQNILAVF